MALVVTDTEYRNSHGAAPKGRGGWGFKLDNTDVEFWHNGTFSEARAALRRHVGRVDGTAYWVVLP
jgi:hypothetical protein